MNKELRQYECSLGRNHWESYNATSYGKAKSQFMRDIADCVDKDAYKHIKCRVVGPVYTSDDFKRMAETRNIPFAYCGMVVKVGGTTGVIVGHNSSVNINVLFSDGPMKGKVGNCHPNWQTTYYDRAGNIIKSFQN